MQQELSIHKFSSSNSNKKSNSSFNDVTDVPVHSKAALRSFVTSKDGRKFCQARIDNLTYDLHLLLNVWSFVFLNTNFIPAKCSKN